GLARQPRSRWSHSRAGEEVAAVPGGPVSGLCVFGILPARIANLHRWSGRTCGRALVRCLQIPDRRTSAQIAGGVVEDPEISVLETGPEQEGAHARISGTAGRGPRVLSENRRPL